MLNLYDSFHCISATTGSPKNLCLKNDAEVVRCTDRSHHVVSPATFPVITKQDSVAIASYVSSPLSISLMGKSVYGVKPLMRFESQFDWVRPMERHTFHAKAIAGSQRFFCVRFYFLRPISMPYVFPTWLFGDCKLPRLRL